MAIYQPHVYCVTDKRTGKLYIGSRTKHGVTVANSLDYFGSSRNPEYLRGLKSRPLDFTKSILAICETREDAIGFENKLLSSISKKARVHFYNKTFWINGSLKFIPQIHSIATKKKMSEAALGRKFSPEHRKALSDARKGKTPWNKGVSASDIHKQRLSASHMGKEPPNKGTTMSDEQRLKISASLKQFNSGIATI